MDKLQGILLGLHQHKISMGKNHKYKSSCQGYHCKIKNEKCYVRVQYSGDPLQQIQSQEIIIQKHQRRKENKLLFLINSSLFCVY